MLISLKIVRCDSNDYPDTGGGETVSDFSDSEFRPIIPKHISETSTKRPTIGNDDILFSDFSSDDKSIETSSVSQNESLETENSDSSAKRDERMSDEWWRDPNKPKVEKVQKIENSKVMEVRVLPPKEFLDRMQSGNEDETSRIDRSLADPKQDRTSNLSKQDRALNVESEKPKLTRELLLKILSSFRSSKSSRLAKILADQNIKIDLGNIQANTVYFITKSVSPYFLFYSSKLTKYSLILE